MAVVDGDTATEFAPAARATADEILRQQRIVTATSAVRVAFDVMPLPLTVLNEYRQIVHANEAFLGACRPAPPEAIVGRRPGEAVGCRNADIKPTGCGTAEGCRTCAVVHAILDAQKGKNVSADCRIGTKVAGTDLEMRVWTRPFHVGEEHFTLLIMMDISDERRRQLLERVFFHDLLNSAGQVRGLCELLHDPPSDERPELVSILEHVSSDLIEQIEAHRAFAAGERGELVMTRQRVRSRAILDGVAEMFANDPIAAGRTLRIAPESDDVEFETDRALIRRVLANLAKNALEASPEAAVVTLSCAAQGGRVGFRVHNRGAMPRDVQLQVFQRFFSTKGSGRGLGTYGARLIAERYLGGSVSFHSAETTGTTFVVELPI